VRKSKGKRHLGRPRHSWKHDIKADEAVALVIRVANPRIPYKEKELCSMESVSWLVVTTSTRLITLDANQSLLSVLHVVTVDQKHNLLNIICLGYVWYLVFTAYSCQRYSILHKRACSGKFVSNKANVHTATASHLV